MYSWGNAYNLEGMWSGETFTENVFWTDDPNSYQHTGAIIDKDCRDYGNVGNTHILRQGLLLHRQRSNKQYIHWQPGVMGFHRIDAILLWPLNMLRFASSGTTAVEKKVPVLIEGRIMLNKLFQPKLSDYAGAVTTPTIVGTDHEYIIQNQLSKRFTWQDRLATPTLPWLGYAHNALTNTTVLTDDYHGFCITNTGAAGAQVYTLPAPKAGLEVDFHNVAGQSMTVASAEGDNIVIMNDAAADSVVIATASEMIGAHLRLIGLNATTWLAIPNLWEGQTLTLNT